MCVILEVKDDIGCIENLNLKISLKVTVPVTRSYISVQKPLYREVKDYLHDLIAQGWISKLTSSDDHMLSVLGKGMEVSTFVWITESRIRRPILIVS